MRVVRDVVWRTRWRLAYANQTWNGRSFTPFSIRGSVEISFAPFSPLSTETDGAGIALDFLSMHAGGAYAESRVFADCG